MAEADLINSIHSVSDDELNERVLDLTKKVDDLTSKIDEILSLSRLNNKFINSR